MTPPPEPAQVLPPGDEAIAACVASLERGRPIIVPTDTVYGLAARATDSDAVARLFELKKRPLDNSIAVLVADHAQAAELADTTPADPLIRAFWPGALTTVVDKLATSPLVVGAPDGTVGLRAPANDFVRALAAVVGPIAATSANISGEPPATTVEEIARLFGSDIGVLVDAGELRGQPSTVARVAPGDGDLTVFREGAIAEADLRAALN